MGGAEVLDLARTAIWVTIKIAAPVMLAGLAVGFLVSLFQALTQIQEQTLSFAIKLIAVAITIAAMSGFLGSEILVYTMKLFNDFPNMT